MSRHPRLISFRQQAPRYGIRSITSSWINYELTRENVQPQHAGSPHPLPSARLHMLDARGYLCKQTAHAPESLIQT